MSDGDPVRGVVVGHGAMSEGLVDAVRQIAGADEEALVPISNEGRSPETLSQEIDQLLGDSRAVIFTDMRSGSCAMAARLTCRDQNRRVVVCGANLPMLLDFVFHRDMELDVLVRRITDCGRRGIESIPRAKTDDDPALSG
jgi:mannose/fructose-specific phosphotransferase system component IIA